MKERKRKLVMKTDPIQLEVKLYIKKSMEDELNLDNLYHSKQPLMIRENIQLPFSTDKSIYDPNTYTKV